MTTSTTAPNPRDPEAARVAAAPVPAWLPLVAVGAIGVVAHLVGRSSSLAPRLSLGAPPFIGEYAVRIGAGTLLAASVGVVGVALAPVALARLRWWVLLVSAWIASSLFAVTLAAADGTEAVWEPLATGFEYRRVLGDIEAAGPAAFTRGFVDALPGYPTHVRGHPVAAPLAFWVHERLGLVGPEWSAALVIVVGTSVVVSVAVVVRSLAGEAVARRAVPFLALGPSLVWVATSADALFAGVVAASVALFAVASARPAGARGDAVAVVAGAVGALALHLSYGAVLMLVPTAVVVLSRRRIRPLLFGTLGAAAVTAGFLALGFWWFDGLVATRTEYAAGAGGVRPLWYFATLANPAALAAALGPAVVVALARVHDRRVWIAAGGALAGVVVADLSGLSKAEVERIWLPFVPFLVVAAAVFPRTVRARWLAAQVAAAVVLQSVLDSPW